MNFVNQLDREVEIFRINNDGLRTSAGKVQPGEVKRVQTDDRRPWEVVSDQFKELYLPNAGAESDAVLKWFTSGKIYQIINIKTGSVVDLNGNDRSSSTLLIRLRCTRLTMLQSLGIQIIALTIRRYATRRSLKARSRLLLALVDH